MLRLRAAPATAADWVVAIADDRLLQLAYMCHVMSLRSQLRRRQPGVKDVVVEEQRYDSLAATGVSADSLAPPFETMAPSRPEPAGLPAVDPAVAAVEEALLGIAPPDGPAFGATFNASDPDDP